MEIKMKLVSELVPYENNPRHNEEAVEKVAASIREFGFNVPIIIDVNNVIVAGHTRLEAAKVLDIEYVPTICADHLTDEQVKAFRLADNKVSEFSTWDLSKLEDELQSMTFDFDMESFGFDFSGLSVEEQDYSDTERETFEDEIPDVDEKSAAISQFGDVWKLGRHRLVCGDSTDRKFVSKLMNGQVADMVFTDPPYGMKKESDGVLNDNLNYDDLLDFNKKWIPLTLEFLKDLGAWYCWGIDEPLMDIYSEILKPLKRKNEIVIRNYITWAKHSAFGMKSPLRLSYPRETEKCWFIVKGSDWNNNNVEFFNYKYLPLLEYLRGEAEKVNLTEKRLRELTGVQMYGHWFSKSQFTVIPEKHYSVLQNEYAKNGAFLLSYDEIRALINKLVIKPFFDLTWFDDGDIPLTDVWRNSITSSKEREHTGDHATPKPIKICERGIVTSSKPGEIVLDVFGGSGSTLIACEQLDRTCYMMELDPKYCDVIIKRWETLTGKKAVRVE